jgi:hypothetical protein
LDYDGAYGSLLSPDGGDLPYVDRRQGEGIIDEIMKMGKKTSMQLNFICPTGSSMIARALVAWRNCLQPPEDGFQSGR